MAAAALGLGVASIGQAQNNTSDNGNRQWINTEADYKPFTRFTPLASSSQCPGEEGGRGSEPFIIPSGYQQQVFAEETDGRLEDLWDMHTQNAFGKDAGRYVYRTHEVGGQDTSEDPALGKGGGLSVTDLKTGETEMLIERNDFERFDGLVFTPWGTLLAAEEVNTAAFRDPTVPRAEAGLVYEFFLDEYDPSKLDPSRE